MPLHRLTRKISRILQPGKFSKVIWIPVLLKLGYLEHSRIWWWCWWGAVGISEATEWIYASPWSITFSKKIMVKTHYLGIKMNTSITEENGKFPPKLKIFFFKGKLFKRNHSFFFFFQAKSLGALGNILTCLC